MANPLPRSVVLLGDAHAPEFAPVVALLRGTISHRRLLECPTLTGLSDRIARSATTSELVVVCQSWTDQFPRSAVHSLLTLLPMTRIICCRGAWCESDGRNRDLWPLALQVSVLEAESLLRRLLAFRGMFDPAPPGSSPPTIDPPPAGHPTSSPGRVLTNTDADSPLAPTPDWAETGPLAWLPLTASRAEIFGQRFGTPSASAGGDPPSARSRPSATAPHFDLALGQRPGATVSPVPSNPNRSGPGRTDPARVCIDTPDRALRTMLGEFFRERGWEPTRDGEPAELLLFDADPWGGERRDRLTRQVQQLSPRHSVLITGCPWEARGPGSNLAERMPIWSKLAPLHDLEFACQAVSTAQRHSDPRSLFGRVGPPPSQIPGR